MDRIELSRLAAGGTPRMQEFAVGRKAMDPRVAYPSEMSRVPSGRNRQVGGHIEWRTHAPDGVAIHTDYPRCSEPLPLTPSFHQQFDPSAVYFSHRMVEEVGCNRSNHQVQCVFHGG